MLATQESLQDAGENTERKQMQRHERFAFKTRLTPVQDIPGTLRELIVVVPQLRTHSTQPWPKQTERVVIVDVHAGRLLRLSATCRRLRATKKHQCSPGCWLSEMQNYRSTMLYYWLNDQKQQQNSQIRRRLSQKHFEPEKQ